jgi:hypothetical protein
MGLMNLSLPTVSVTLGPTWASELNTAIETIESHDHTSGKGALIVPSAININSNLTFATNAATDLAYTNFVNQSATLVGSLLVYGKSGDLYWNNGSGIPVQVTNGGSVITTPANLQVLNYIDVAVDTIIGAASTDVFYAVDTSATRTITLPLASSVAAGRIFCVKDATGQSETNVLTLATNGADLIDGESTQTFESNFGCWFVIGDGISKWRVI